jgi:hypothetical protein
VPRLGQRLTSKHSEIISKLKWPKELRPSIAKTEWGVADAPEVNVKAVAADAEDDKDTSDTFGVAT